MSSEGEAFYQRLVKITDLDIENMKIGKLSKEARKLIKQYNLTSLDGLLGDDWETEAHRLTVDRLTEE